MSVVSFAGLFYSTELLNICVRDVSLQEDHIKNHVPCSETNVYREAKTCSYL